MGKKYIIEVEDKPFELLSEDGFTSEKLYKVKGFNSLVFDWNGLNMLTPYTEDSAYAHGYTEAESKYREIRDELEKQAHQRGYEEAYDTAYADAEKIYESGKRAMYQKGLKDAWDAARTLWNTPNRKEIFGHTSFNTALMTLTAQEVIEKIRAYEQAQKEIQVGDEIEAMAGNAVVIEVIDGGQTVRYMYPDTITGRNKACNVTRTGRHFPEIAAVLEKMQMKDGDNE